MNLITTIPDWAASQEAQAFWLGLGAGVMVRIVRAGLRWMKSAGNDLGRGD